MTQAIPGDREIWREGVETRMLVSQKNGARELCVFEQWVAPGVGAPAHSHTVEEVLTVLAGGAEVWVDDARFELQAGQSVVIPAGRKHGFTNIGRETLHVHAVLAAAYFEAAYDGRPQLVRRWLA
jgi:quercetin dioxygenase-like cupin family protein